MGQRGNSTRLIQIVGFGVLTLSAMAAGWLSVAMAQDREKSTSFHREGVRVDKKQVEFRTENDSLQMIEGEASIQVLQNLAAQRIYRANRDDPQDNRWIVSGRFTEFEGQNFFLIETATRPQSAKLSKTSPKK